MATVTVSKGFTLLEVLIAMAITAFVAAVAYSSLATVLSAVESTRESANRTFEINRAWMIISRDLRQFAPRTVRDEFGEGEPAMSGGPVARFLLSFTRSGWHNPNGHPRSNLQRVNYRLEDNILWRDTYPVLDRTPEIEAQELKLLEGVASVELRFLRSLGKLELSNDSNTVETRNWDENWLQNGGSSTAVPVAVDIELELEDWGPMRRLYELPPL